MVVQHKKADGRGMFFVELDGDVVAEMIYSIPSEDKIIIEHTEVDDPLQGRNIGYEMVHASVKYARQHGITIIPVCTFAKAVFDKKPDFGDVLFK